MYDRRRKKGFTLVEVMTATFIAIYTMLAATGAYMMFWTWWYETRPEVEAQRMARIALSTIICGRPDPTAGAYSVGAVNFTRRNGISAAIRAPNIPTPQQISFGLEPDASNSRSYLLGLDPASGLNAVFYVNNIGLASIIPSTLGITDLRFQYYTDPEGATHNDMIVITVTVDRNIVRAGAAPRLVHVVYSQLAALRNI